MNNEVDEFLGDLNKSEADPFKSETVDTLAKPEETTSEGDEKEEKLPFHKDPKVQRFIEKEIEKRMSSQPKVVEKEIINEDSDPMADVLVRIIGNDTPEKLSAIKDFQKALDSRDARVRDEALREIDYRVEEEKQAEVDAQNELVEGFENIEETFGVDITSNKPSAVSTRKEFVDFIQRVAPKDSEGQVTEFPDLEETFKLFQDIKKGSAPTSNRAKELASRSVGRSADSSSVPQNTDKSWNAVERWISKLSN